MKPYYSHFQSHKEEMSNKKSENIGKVSEFLIMCLFLYTDGVLNLFYKTYFEITETDFHP